MNNNRIFDADTDEFKLQKLQSGYMLMTLQAKRLLECAVSIGNRDMVRVADGVVDLLLAAKDYADQLRLPESDNGH